MFSVLLRNEFKKRTTSEIDYFTEDRARKNLLIPLSFKRIGTKSIYFYSN